MGRPVNTQSIEEVEFAHFSAQNFEQCFYPEVIVCVMP